MSTVLNRIYNRVRNAYWLALGLSLAASIGVAVLRTREIFEGVQGNPAFERWGIVAALVFIPLSLKLFPYLLKKNTRDGRVCPHAYYRFFVLRLLLLTTPLLVNLCGLYLEGSPNFFYMIFINLIAFLFCTPNKSELFALCNVDDNIRN